MICWRRATFHHSRPTSTESAAAGRRLSPEELGDILEKHGIKAMATGNDLTKPLHLT